MHRLRRGGRSPSPRGRRDEGFSIVEMTISLAILAVTAAFFAAELATNYTVYGHARDRTVAEELATSQIERARDMAYDDVGTTPGNPVGLIPKSSPVTVDGRAFAVETRVKYVGDPVPGRFATGTNYKQMRVTVTRIGSTVSLADMQTLIAPRTPSSLTRGTIKVLVSDYAANTPISGANVTVTGGPSPNASDTSDSLGRTEFAGLLPTTATGPASHYVIAATASGYTTMPEDRPNAAAVYPKLVATQTFDTAVRMFKTVGIEARLVHPDGSVFTYPATISIGSTRGSGVLPVTGGALVFTRFGTNDIIPTTSYTLTASATIAGAVTITSPPVTKVVPADYPTVLTSTFTLTMPAIVAQPTTVIATDTLGNPVPGATIKITGGQGQLNLIGVTDVTGLVVLQTLPSATPYTVTVPVGGAVITEFTQPLNVTTTPVTLNLVIATPPNIDVVVADEIGVPAFGATGTITGGDLGVTIPITIDAAGHAIVPLPISTAKYRVVFPAQLTFKSEKLDVEVTPTGPRQFPVILRTA